MRATGSLCMVLAITGLRVQAQIGEPILTQSAPIEPGSGIIKLDYAGGIGRAGGSSQVIPEGWLEVGVYPGLEALVRFPLLRVRQQGPGSAVIGGGQLAMGARYLLAGGAGSTYAVSAELVVEPPTGDTRLVGNATDVIPALLADWHPIRQVAVQSNLRFNHSIGGTGPKSAFLEYSNSVAWLTMSHLTPVFELAGSTNSITSRSEWVAQPELILRTGAHLELKAGLQLGITSLAPPVGLRAQVSWSWTRRQ